MDIKFVYMTAGDIKEAEKIGKLLVEQRLAACVNIMDNMNSIYRWEGEIQNDREVVMIAKTTQACIPRLVDEVTSLHSYECPCIEVLSVTGGNAEFMKWIMGEVEKTGSSGR